MKIKGVVATINSITKVVGEWVEKELIGLEKILLNNYFKNFILLTFIINNSQKNKYLCHIIILKNLEKKKRLQWLRWNDEANFYAFSPGWFEGKEQKSFIVKKILLSYTLRDITFRNETLTP